MFGRHYQSEVSNYYDEKCVMRGIYVRQPVKLVNTLLKALFKDFIPLINFDFFTL
jgi:hypothetical protein